MAPAECPRLATAACRRFGQASVLSGRNTFVTCFDDKRGYRNPRGIWSSKNGGVQGGRAQGRRGLHALQGLQDVVPHRGRERPRPPAAAHHPWRPRQHPLVPALPRRACPQVPPPGHLLRPDRLRLLQGAEQPRHVDRRAVRGGAPPAAHPPRSRPRAPAGPELGRHARAPVRHASPEWRCLHGGGELACRHGPVAARGHPPAFLPPPRDGGGPGTGRYRRRLRAPRGQGRERRVLPPPRRGRARGRAPRQRA